MSLPVIAMVLGDPAGIGPELVAKVLSDSALLRQAHFIIIADRDELQKGMAIADRHFPYREVAAPTRADLTVGEACLIHHRGSHPAPFEYGKATAQSGVYILETLEKALELTRCGLAQSICFAPLNKQAMHMGGLTFRDELHWFAHRLNWTSFCCEVNVVDHVWAGRATSHIPFRDIVGQLSVDGILDTIILMHNTLRQAGFAAPRIAVQALNPHGGENGLFGDEELTLIRPAMEKARQQGIAVFGPYPADTTWKAMQNEKLDAVVSMYHDQFATALKMLGFERGVTVQGGLPVPITTANHGTAYNLYGQNAATPSAFEQAVLLAIRMARGSQPTAMPGAQ
ncbi:4-hydroxythreonine-4-phosphate dehydrogenase PdxA [Intestinirhabdus alba]|jgi:4-hydroxy-L-threonine phosphate dehydrogenase PdxA|uniref:4-hydroxythreonine-4-phosphate dehydrogenase n=1 Tax=Intestinirhabdus alba TaxID=2899544 RepID=A0A6L6IQL6_9ENTR|nr:4-hydroxythreonine-4-phosphate dehydrogenase PdxA [Intestinirhabdus alba]MTH48809.1 4-hydroxythreonine-4-phosphate dehydrogenase [Intestinirhabdus alba]